MGQKIKINIPPESGRFKKNVSGNPGGKRRRSDQETIPEAIRRKLREPVSDPVRRRKRTNRHELAARRLIAQAVNGDTRAISEISKQRKLATRYAPTVRKISFKDAQKRQGSLFDLDEQFFEKQAREKAEFRRKAREEATLADYIEQELRRRRMVDRDGNGKLVRMNMQDIIVHNLTNEYAKGDLAAIALIEKLLPKNKAWTPPIFSEAMKPTAGESADFELAKSVQREDFRTIYKEFHAGEGDWDDDSVVDARMKSEPKRSQKGR
jgi:hypothetical protein